MRTLKRYLGYLSTVFLFAVLSLNLSAQTFGGKGQKVTVAQAKKLNDDTHVVLEGYIIGKKGAEEYEFKDSTGTIIVEIDHDKWRGLSVNDKQKVIIEGEVDKDIMSTKIDVDKITLAK